MVIYGKVTNMPNILKYWDGTFHVVFENVSYFLTHFLMFPSYWHIMLGLRAETKPPRGIAQRLHIEFSLKGWECLFGDLCCKKFCSWDFLSPLP